jgi:hypothetical protein
MSIVAEGKASWPVWPWPIGNKWYNAASPKIRIQGWQKVWLGVRMGLLPGPKLCSICLSQVNTQTTTRPTSGAFRRQL